MNENQQPYNGQIDEALLTAYALNELEGPERALVEAALKTDHKAQVAVDEIRTVAGHLRDAAAHEEEYAPSASLRELIEERLEGMKPAVVREGDRPVGEVEGEGDSPIFAQARIKTVPRRRRWVVLAWTSAAVLLVAVTIPSLPRFQQGTRSDLAMDMEAMKSAAPAAEPVTAADSAGAVPALGERGEAAESEEASEKPLVRETMAGEFAGKAADKPAREARYFARENGDASKSGSALVEAESEALRRGASTPAEASLPPAMKGGAGYAYDPFSAGRALSPPASPGRSGEKSQPNEDRKAGLSDGAPVAKKGERGMAERVLPKPAAPTAPWSPTQAAGPGAIPVPYPTSEPSANGQFPLAQSAVMPRAKAAAPIEPVPGPSAEMPGQPRYYPVPGTQARTPLATQTAPQPQVEMPTLTEEVTLEQMENLDVQVLRGREADAGQVRRRLEVLEMKKQEAAQPAYAGGGMGGMGGMGMGGYGAAANEPTAGQPMIHGYALGNQLNYGGVPGPETLGEDGVMGRRDRYVPFEGRQQLDLGTEQYAPVIENSFQSPVTEPESTVSADVDTASYPNVRRFLENNQAPPPGAVRVEEMVNYFDYDYPQPKDDTPFSVNMETASCPWNEANRLVRIALKAKEIDPAERGPSNLVFLLDVSGSMRDPNKLPLVKDGMAMLVDQLTEDDRVSIVTYAGEAGLALEPTLGTGRKKILDRIEALSAGGSTHGSAGIQMAYDQAMANFVSGGNNRVVLCTDGDLNVGVTDDNELVRLIQEKASSGVFLTVIGFGTGNLKDAKLEQLADKGNGTYAYVDGLQEAKKVFVEQVSGSLVTVAKDVKIQIEFNPAKVQSYRLIGYENRLLAPQDFNDDMKDAGEIGAGHSVTFFYEVVPTNLPVGQIAALNRAQENLRYQRIMSNALTEVAESGELLALKLRYKLSDEQESRLLEVPVMDSGKRFGEASSDFRFAAAVAAFGMLLRGSQYNQGLTFSAVEEFAAGAADHDPAGRRGEFVDLVRRARTLYGDTTQVGADAMMVPRAAAEAAPAEVAPAAEPSVPRE